MKKTLYAYNDILNVSRPISKKHRPMPRQKRAAQFAAFAALSGYGAAIIEEARLTQPEIILTDDEKTLIDRQLQILRADINQHPQVMMTVFQPDQYKSGGAYVEISGRIKKIDPLKAEITFLGGESVNINHIIQMEISGFAGNYP